MGNKKQTNFFNARVETISSTTERVNLYFEEPLYTFKFGGKNYYLKFIKRIKRTKIQQYLEGNSARLPLDFITPYLIRKLPKKEYELINKAEKNKRQETLN